MTDPQIIWFLLILLAAGVVAGFTSGLFGIGGGVVLVPALMTILPLFHTTEGVVMHMAVGTSLALILPGSAMAARKQFQMGNLDLKLLFFWVRTVILGVIAGSILINFISTEELKIYFAIYLLCVTLYSLLQPKPQSAGERVPARSLMGIAGFIVGGLSVLLGIGGGTFTVPFFNFSHYPLKKAIALSTATGLFIGLGGTVGVLLDGWGDPGRTPYSWGFVNIPAFILLTPGMMIFSPLGARSANHLPNRPLKALFIGFFALMTCYMFWKVF
jgi:uncharacterized membrane protein YfcA